VPAIEESVINSIPDNNHEQSCVVILANLIALAK
jgi:hypothetical protein